MMNRYAVGLDIGVASVGWAALALDREEKPAGILDMGVRVFPAAEHPKTGASLALPRREARSGRRRLRRHRHRNERIRRAIVEQGLLTESELEELFQGRLEDIYALRVRALDEPVNPREFARILIHLSQRRGFRSNRKGEEQGADGRLLAAVKENRQKMEEKGYRTAAELLLKDESFAEHKRNRGGEYLSTISRDMTEDEVHKLFAAQRSLGSEFAGEELEKRYLDILLSQRSFDEGPGGNSPYGGSRIENMVGKCTFEKGEARAAKAEYSFEYFAFLEKLNHIRMVKSGESLPLTEGQRRKLIELAHKSDSITYLKVRKELGLGEEWRFNMLRYEAGVQPEETEKKAKLTGLKAYHQMRKAFEKVSKGVFAQLTREQRNLIGRTLSLYKTSEKIREALAEGGLEPCLIEAAENAGSFRGFGHLSAKACDKLIPFLEQGMNYNQACAAAGYDFRAHEEGERSLLLHCSQEELADITSPVVKRSIAQSIKVLNAIIRKQGGSPSYVNIELARELAKDLSERKKLKKDMEANRSRNEAAMERLKKEYGLSNAGGQDLVKFKLFQEQDGVCAYSLKRISIERLFEPGYAEVDHIIPYSISFDDSYKNKVLVLTEENRNKGNRLPMEYLSGKRREDFQVWVNSTVRDYRKRQNLLKEKISQEEEAQFKERSLQDTKHASRVMMNLIRDKLAFAPSPTGRKKRVTAVNGQITAVLRKRWGLNKNREDGDLHHSLDAVVIACATDAMIQQISRNTALRECRYMQHEKGSLAIDGSTGEVLRDFPYPWPDFRRELEGRLARDPAKVLGDMKLPFYMGKELPKAIFVSRMPRRKVTGAAHKDTVKSARLLEQGYVLVKRSITELKLKDGEIEGYYNKDSDILLYEALKKQLEEHGGDGKKAFAQPFHKPKRDGSPGPLVNKVKLTEKTTMAVPVQGGQAVADNDSMVRTDVFYVEGEGYYLVPIYVADTLKDKLPGRACVANKSYAEWKEMREEDFIFSLYPDDLFLAEHRGQLKFSKVHKESTLPDSFTCKSQLMYFTGTDISTGAISGETHDGAYKSRGIGVKTLKRLEKYTVDVLGEYHKVGKEKRLGFENMRR